MPRIPSFINNAIFFIIRDLQTDKEINIHHLKAYRTPDRYLFHVKFDRGKPGSKQDRVFHLLLNGGTGGGYTIADNANPIPLPGGFIRSRGDVQENDHPFPDRHAKLFKLVMSGKMEVIETGKDRKRPGKNWYDPFDNPAGFALRFMYTSGAKGFSYNPQKQEWTGLWFKFRYKSPKNKQTNPQKMATRRNLRKTSYSTVKSYSNGNQRGLEIHFNDKPEQVILERIDRLNLRMAFSKGQPYYFINHTKTNREKLFNLQRAYDKLSLARNNAMKLLKRVVSKKTASFKTVKGWVGDLRELEKYHLDLKDQIKFVIKRLRSHYNKNLHLPIGAIKTIPNKGATMDKIRALFQEPKPKKKSPKRKSKG